MRCVVPNCNEDSDVSKDITFHSFPHKQTARSVWLKVLNIEPTKINESSTICSKHFLAGDLYMNRSGFCRVRAGSLPIVNVQNVQTGDTNDVKVCRVCFVIDCKLYKMTEYNKLDQAYKIVTGLSIEKESHLPQYLCGECAQRLLNCVYFRTRSLRAHLILLDTAKKYQRITLQLIKSVIGFKSPVGSHLKKSETNHFEIPMNHVKEEIDERVDITDADHIKVEKDISEEAPNSSRYIPELHEDIDIKMDVVEYDDNEIDQTITSISTDIVINDMGDKNEKGFFISLANKGNTSVNKDPLSQDGGKSGDEEDEFLIEKTSKGYIEKKVKKKEKRKSRNYLSGHICRTIADKFIIKPGSAKARPPEILSPTNIVKLRKRVDSVQPREEKIAYRTISDVPLWGRLKANSAIKPYSCKLCKFQTGYKKELKTHEITHHRENPHAQDVCDKKNSDWGVPSGGKMVSCFACKQVFPSVYKLYQHIEVTSGGKRYSCSICKEQFKLNFELNKHYKIHTGEKPYPCDVCQKRFNFETSLALHMKRLHPDESVNKISLDKKIKNK